MHKYKPKTISAAPCVPSLLDWRLLLLLGILGVVEAAGAAVADGGFLGDTMVCFTKSKSV